MIETDQQRRWWFATHPEYRSSRKGRKRTDHGGEEAKPRVYSPREIDAYVAEGLKYFPTGPVAAMLKALKWGLGTNDGPTPLDFLFKGTGAEQGAADETKETTKDETQEDVGESVFWDSVVRGIDKTLDFWGLAGILTPSRVLARNLIKAGFPRLPDHVPHHIVPTYDSRFPEAVAVRKALTKYKIDINDAVNGVWLPAKHGVAEGAYHPALHSQEYYRQVEMFLSQAKNKREAIEALKEIGHRLSTSTFFD